jgi:hypothetical protein
MMNINKASDWITDAKKGDETTYYTGWLIKDRGDKKNELSQIANYVWAMSERGLVYLAQRKTPNWAKSHPEYHYIMQRSSRKRA